MKLSEMSTDRALDVLCELTPAIANIVDDKDIISGLTDIMPNESVKESDNLSYGVRIICGAGKLAPTILKTHRDDVYTILSVLNEKPVAEIAAQPVLDTIRQVREAFQDEDLLSFFRSSARRAKTESSAPSAESPVSE